MRAMVQHRFGTASEVLQLEEIETPVPGEGQLLVRVKATSANPYDLAFQLGGTTSPSAIRKVLVEDGTLVQCAGDGGRLLGPIVNMGKAMLTNRFVSQTLRVVNTVEDTATLDAVREMVEAGELRPVIDSTVPFEETGFAVDLVESGSPGGKVAISGVE